VLSSKGQAKVFPSTVYGSLRDNRIKTNPTGRVPTFGFGKVWGNYSSVRRMIGSPTTTESGMLMNIREAAGSTTMTQANGTTYNISRNGKWTSSVSDVDLTPLVEGFYANMTSPQIGDQLVISWSVKNVNYVLLEIYDGNSDIKLYAYEGMAPNASLPIQAPATVNQKLRFVLMLPNPAVPGTYDRTAWTELMVDVAPSQTTTITTYAAYQAFEHGYMIWRSDNDDVYVFGLGVTVYDSTAGLPDNPYATPPQGLIAPINAFGRAWANNDYLRTYLGWATGSEQGYQATITYRGRPETATEFTITVPGGNVLTLYNGGGAWHVR
jgi:hypothetical protein